MARRGAYIGQITVGMGVPIQVEAAAYFAAMTVSPPLAFRDAVNQAIYEWKKQGTWAKIKGGWLFCAGTSQAGLLSIIGDTARNATITGALTHVPLKGFEGFSASNVLNLGGIGQAILGNGSTLDLTPWTLHGLISLTNNPADAPNSYAIIIADGGTENAPGTRQGCLYTGSASNALNPSCIMLGATSGGSRHRLVDANYAGGPAKLIGGGRGNGYAITNVAIITAGGGTVGNNYRSNAVAILQRWASTFFLDGTTAVADVVKFNNTLTRLLETLGALD